MIKLIEIGYSKKPYGKDGHLRLNVNEPFVDSLLNARALFFDLDGSCVPFLIESINDNNTITAKLDEIDSPQEASLLVNRTILLEQKEVSINSFEKDILQNDAFTGYGLFDKNQEYCGKIIKTESFPYQLMAHVELNDKISLIPLHRDWIINMDHSAKQLHMDLPEGLIE